MTRTKTSMMAAAAIAALGLLAVTGASYADRGEGDCGPGLHHGPGGHGARAGMLFEKFDVNGDGSVTRAEIDETRGAKLQAADGNADAQLTLEEFQTLWLEMTRPMMVDRFQDLDEDGNGQVTEAELGRPLDNMFVFLDRNEDGSITQQELRSLHDQHGKHHRDHGEEHDDD